MAEAKELQRGDLCPNCRGELRPAYVPTDEEWKRSKLRDYPEPLPVGADSAPPEQREDLGELHVCERCGYQTRFAFEESANGAATESAKSAQRVNDADRARRR